MTVRFFVLGDWGGRHSLFAKSKALVAAEMTKIYEGLDADQHIPTFVISVGDNFYPRGVRSTADPAWQKMFLSVYEKLTCPWYSCLGNHDWEGNHQAQIDYRLDSRWHMEGLYYTKMIGPVQFFFIDTVTLCPEYSNTLVDMSRNTMAPNHVFSVQDSNYIQQLEWLERELTMSTAEWRIVVGHYPIFSGGSHGQNTSEMQVVNEILKRHKIDVYFCGHDHSLQHMYHPKLTQFHHILSGSGSGALLSPVKPISSTCWQQQIAGFVSCSVDGDMLIASFIGESGDVLHTVDINKQYRT